MSCCYTCPKFIIAILVAILVFIIILVVGLVTDLLRQSKQDKPGIEPPSERMYSFHKFQLWLWTMVICPCFVLYWGVHDVVFINTASLVLLGISGGSGITAEIINSVQKPDPSKGIFLKSRMKSENFWSDILKDDSGQVSILRLQQLIFTLVYIVVYICSFSACKGYPEFDETAYTLMGISTSAFLLGKGLNK